MIIFNFHIYLNFVFQLHLKKYLNRNSTGKTLYFFFSVRFFFWYVDNSILNYTYFNYTILSLQGKRLHFIFNAKINFLKLLWYSIFTFYLNFVFQLNLNKYLNRYFTGKTLDFFWKEFIMILFQTILTLIIKYQVYRENACILFLML